MADRTEALRACIAEQARHLPEVRLMEVCGTHTESICKYALGELLPPTVRLVSGPGCPVCVTSGGDIEMALEAGKRGAKIVCFGDMLRVPCRGESLGALRAHRGDVQILSGAMDALSAAKREPTRQIVYFAVGFETTSPSTAALLLAARRENVRNLSVLCAHKTMPSAIRALLGGGSRIDGLLCPGHVAAITGADAFRFVSRELGLPAAVAGFLPEQILCAIAQLLRMLREKRSETRNLYPEAVSAAPNGRAMELLREAFIPCDAVWRGLGRIAGSGLSIREELGDWDAAKRFSLRPGEDDEAPGCLCGAILRGEKRPGDCGLFGTACTPERPAGPCMVSREGACASDYRYGRRG